MNLNLLKNRTLIYKFNSKYWTKYVYFKNHFDTVNDSYEQRTLKQFFLICCELSIIGNEFFSFKWAIAGQ